MSTDTKLNCYVCTSDFDAEIHIPRLYPTCGHTFCEPCFKKMMKKDNQSNCFRSTCPLCRHRYTMESNKVQQFPKNVMILDLIEANKQPQASKCRIHKTLNDIFCYDCYATICYKCLVKDHQNHNYCLIEQFQVEVEQNFQKFSEESRNFEERWKQIEKSAIMKAFLQEISQVVNKLMKIIEDFQQKCSNNAAKIVDDIKDSDQLDQLQNFFNEFKLKDRFTDKAIVMNKKIEVLRTRLKNSDFQEAQGDVNKSRLEFIQTFGKELENLKSSINSVEIDAKDTLKEEPNSSQGSQQQPQDMEIRPEQQSQNRIHSEFTRI